MEMMRQNAEWARIRAEQDAIERQDFDQRFNVAQDDANAAVDQYHLLKKMGKKETRAERIERRVKWSQYKRMQEYRWDRWGE